MFKKGQTINTKFGRLEINEPELLEKIVINNCELNIADLLQKNILIDNNK